jgi:integrase
MGLVKRGKVWWMYFTYQGRQVRKSSGTPDRKLADAILSKLKVQIVEGQYFERAAAASHTFIELMERYEKEHVARKLRHRGLKSYMANLRSFFGRYTLAEITPKVIVAYKNKRYQDGMAPATINRELANLKKAFNLAMREWEWCHQNPVSRVSMEKENNKRDRWLNSEEEGRLLASCAPWLQDLVTFALNTGMRMGEILELTWRGVDFNRRTVTVFRSKNGERRTIPANQAVLTVLKSKAKVRSLATDRVFCSKAFTPIESGHLRRAFRLALKKAAIEDFHFHDLRHTFATTLVQNGIDLYKVQQLLGHKSPIMTQRYAHHYPESLRDGVEILDRRRDSSTKVAQSAGLEAGVNCVSG